MVDLSQKHSVISIILPFKNEEAYLTECIESILNQSYPYWELVLVDDHSTDDSTTIASNFTNRDARIRYFENPGQGVIDAMKHGFHQSTGALITRMDGDDIKTRDNLEQLIAQATPGAVAIGQVKYFRKDGLGLGYEQYADWVNTLTASSNNFSEIYKECVIPSPCWLAYRADFVNANGFDSTLYPEDYDLCFRFYQLGLQTKGTDGIIHLWRDHAIRTTRTSSHYADNRFMSLKLHYFSLIDYDPNKELVLWGAGKKGKQVAKHWSELGYKFDWITDNSKKIGHDIYGTIIKNSVDFALESKHQLIITVADKKGQLEIKNQIENTVSDVYWFC